MGGLLVCVAKQGLKNNMIKTISDMIKAVEIEAENFLKDSNGGLSHLKRNKHMHNSEVDHMCREDVKAVLSQFMNFIAGSRGVDLAHYTKDFNSR